MPPTCTLLIALLKPSLPADMSLATSSDASHLHVTSTRTHHVFINHRGLPVKRGFANHLYSSLKERGISAFLDARELSKGEDVRPEMLEAARTATVFVAIFTQDYAASHWCLDELAEAVESCSGDDHVIIPVFFGVKSEDLRNDNGRFAEAFKDHLADEHCKGKHTQQTIDRWRDALKFASWRDGFRLETYNGFEGDLLTELVATIAQKIDARCCPMSVDGMPHLQVGLEWRVQKVVGLMRLNEHTTMKFVVLYGMSGVGKTVLAGAVYRSLNGTREFDARSFVRNCGDVSQIQRSLRHDLLLDKDDDHGKMEVEIGRAVLRDRLRKKKVLIVLDDVKQFDDVLKIIDLKFLHPDSRILVTSTDQAVYRRANYLCGDEFQVDCYHVRPMYEDDSKQLFCLHAFGSSDLPQAFKQHHDLVAAVVKECDGLPLSLVVLGAHLGQYSASCAGGAEDKQQLKKIWEETIQKLRENRFPDKKVEGTLKISYDALEENEKEMFLDVACLLNREAESCVLFFWESIEKSYPISGMEKLKRLCLVEVLGDCGIQMHSQLRNLGREIVRKVFKETGEWSRIWADNDLENLVMTSSSTRKLSLAKVRGISTSLPKLDVALLSQMESLQLLFLNGTRLVTKHRGLKKLVTKRTGLKELPIRWLKWHLHPCFPPLTIPKQFCRELRVLQICESESDRCKDGVTVTTAIESIWQQSVNHGVLKRLLPHALQPATTLSRSLQCSTLLKQLELYLVESSTFESLLPSIGNLQALEHFQLTDHTSRISTLSPSLGQLRNLQYLRLECPSLSALPSALGDLQALKLLDMSGCTSLSALPSALGDLQALKWLDMSGCTSLSALPSALGDLQALERLIMNGCTGLSALPSTLGDLQVLEWLVTSGCTGLSALPSALGDLHALKWLFMSSCTGLSALPSTLGDLQALEWLVTSGCTGLSALPSALGDLQALQWLDINGCTGLSALPSALGDLQALEWLDMSGCTGLLALPSTLGDLQALERLFMSGCTGLSALPSTLGDLQALEWLVTSCCTGLSALPSALGDLQALKYLDINGCTGLSALPSALGDLQALEQLDMSGCTGLSALPSALGDLQAAEQLYMRACRGLSALPSALGDVQALRCYFTISYTGLSLLPSTLGDFQAL